MLLDGVVTDGDSEGMRETRSEDRGVCVVCACGWIYSGVNFEKDFLQTRHVLISARYHTLNSTLCRYSAPTYASCLSPNSRPSTQHTKKKRPHAHTQRIINAHATHNLLHARTARNQRAPLKTQEISPYRRTHAVSFVCCCSFKTIRPNFISPG